MSCFLWNQEKEDKNILDINFYHLTIMCLHYVKLLSGDCALVLLDFNFFEIIHKFLWRLDFVQGLDLGLGLGFVFN